jgi:hypothetical protein
MIWHTVSELVLTAPGGGDGGNGVIPDGPATMIPGLEGLGSKIVGWGKGLILTAGVIGLLICSGQIILGRRNRGAMAVDGITGAVWVLGGLSLAGIAVGLVKTFAG